MKIRKASVKDIDFMKKIFLKSTHKDYFGAGEFYLREEYVDPNYKSMSGPYNSRKTFIKNNVESLKERVKAPYLSYVLISEKEIVGYIIVEKHLNRYWVNDLIIDKDHQNKGYAKSLLDKVIKDKKNVYLWVNTKNPAKKFWEKESFKEVLKESLMKR